MEVPQHIPVGDDRRRCVRLIAQSDDDQAVLSDGSRRVRVCCVDRSAEGFGVSYEAKIPWEVGQKLLLYRHEGSYEVQVMYVLEQDGNEQIGLQRVGDFVEDPYASELRFLWGWMRRRLFFGASNATQSIGLIFVLLLVATIVAMVLRPTIPLKTGKSRDFDLASDRNAYQSASDFRRVSGVQGSRGAQRASSGDAWSDVVSGRKELTWEDVEGLLNLTEDQSEKLLARLNEKFSKVSTDANNSQATMADRQRTLATLLKTLPDNALSFLSEEQRRQLKSLLLLLSQQ